MIALRRAARVRFWVGLAMMAGLQAPAWAGPPAAPAPTDLRGWMQRLQQAGATLNYRGTLVSTAGGVVSSSRVVHYCEGKQSYERVDALDGEARQVLRHNELTQTMWPRSRVAVIERWLAMPEFPALPPASGSRAQESYDLQLLGSERVAGHAAQVLMLKPRDAHRFAQRLWAEQQTGLLLRADMLGPGGEPLESASFSEVAIGGRANPEAVLHAMRRLDGYRVVKPQVVRTQLDAEGWTLARPVPGFQLVGCMRKELSPLTEPLGNGSALMAVFSDGLTHVSVFVEPYDPQRHKPVATSLGATHTVMTRAGDWWITAIGDVPMATVQLFSTALERRR